jgi:hypothetical protein
MLFILNKVYILALILISPNPFKLLITIILLLIKRENLRIKFFSLIYIK